MKRLALLPLLFLTACEGPSTPALPPANPALSALVAHVDSLKLPLDRTLIDEESNGGALEGEPALKITDPKLLVDPALPHLRASVVGPLDDPKAVVFSSTEVYYIPFAHVMSVDRKRRLTRMQDRVYRIESNRSQTGDEVTGMLP